MKKIEYHAVIKFLHLIGNTPVQIKINSAHLHRRIAF